jgi:predicted alpha/beta hydrolase
MNKHTLHISESDSIVLTEFPAIEGPAKVIIIASATGVKQTYYYNFATFFSKHNYHVYTFDYEGIGASRPASLLGVEVNASDWGDKDLNAVLAYVKEKHSGNKLIVIGHSIGGQLIGLAPWSFIIDEIILIAAQTGYWKLWPGSHKIQMFLTWHILVPVLTNLFGYFPGKKIGLSEDLPKNVALEWAKWCRSPSYLFKYKENATTMFDNVKAKITSYSFSDDTYAPASAVDWLTHKYTSALITRFHINPDDLKIKKIGHFGFFSIKNQASLWEELKSRL